MSYLTMICLLFFFNHMLIDVHLIKKRCRTCQELIFCFNLLFYLQQNTVPSTNQLNNDVMIFTRSENLEIASFDFLSWFENLEIPSFDFLFDPKTWKFQVLIFYLSCLVIDKTIQRGQFSLVVKQKTFILLYLSQST